VNLPCIFFSIFAFLSINSFAITPYQSFNHSKARLISSHSAVTPNQSFYLAFDIELDQGWHVYWKNPGDSGAEPIFEWEHSGVQISAPIYPLPKRILIEPLVSFGYENRVVLLFEAKLLEDKTTKVNLRAEWLSCRIECVPSFGNFDITIAREDIAKETTFKQDIQSFLSLVPAKLERKKIKGTYSTSNHSLEIIADTLDQGEKLVDFFPDIHTPVLLRKPKVLDRNRLLIPMDPVAIVDESLKLGGVVVLKDLKDNIIAFETSILMHEKNPAQTMGLIWILLFALLGGLILNAMPCVLPVIAIKLMGFLHHRDKENIRLASLAYVLGVVTSFLVLGLILLGLRLSGNVLGWGFQLQSPVFVSLLVMFFMALGFSSLGLFELQAPHALINNPLTKLKRGYLSHFLTGVLSTVVASPCTAPFMGAAMGAAVHLGNIEMLLCFVFVGLGLASPYIIFIFNPNIVSYLPKPGPWMVTFKEALAFVFFATAVWLFWVLHQISSDFLPLLLCILLLSFSVWLHNRTQQKFFALLLGICAFFLAGYTQIRSDSAKAKTTQKGTTALSWEHFDMQAIHETRREGFPVFVNFTADWCITCKVNERVSLADSQVKDAFESTKTKLFKADWTRRDPEITSALESFGRIGVPLYLYWAPGSDSPIVLPELLTPNLILNTLQIRKDSD
jgi:thiol:disulfide interchange protein/DsbC/DsbD-like thiol-disulfide interchange protein